MSPPSLPAKKTIEQKNPLLLNLLSNLHFSYATAYEIMNKSFVFRKCKQKQSKIDFYKHCSKLFARQSNSGIEVPLGMAKTSRLKVFIFSLISY